jgi:hypothetical protein
MAAAAAWLAASIAEAARAGERAYRGAGGVAEEAIGGVRTVEALGGERRERARYAGIIFKNFFFPGIMIMECAVRGNHNQ